MTLKEHIDDISQSLEQGMFRNETEVCDRIVHRILDGLGWPRYDHGFRVREYDLRGLRVDFALCYPALEPKVFVEVKRPGNIDGAEDQLFGYAARENVPIAVLTDGRKWQFFYPGGLGDYDKRKVDALDLIEGVSEESANLFSRYLGYEAIRTDEAAEAIRRKYEELVIQREVEKHLPDAWKNLVKSGDELLLELIAESTKELCGCRPTDEQVRVFLNTLERNTQLPIIPPNPEILPEGGIAPPPKGGIAGRTGLRVVMDDGTVIDRETGSATFVAVIEAFGIEQVHALKLGTDRNPLVSRKNKGEPPGKGRRSDTSDSYSIHTCKTSERRIKKLEVIGERLGKRLQRIDIVKK